MENTLGDFLRSRRARILPEEVGLPSHGRRRVQGLRREEVAQLAGVSVDYYVRLEQGRGGSASDAVLTAVARVLRLDEVEAAHLRSLVRPPKEPAAGARAQGRGRGRGGQPVRPGTRLLLDLMTGVPAFVLGRRMDVLAWNALGDAVNGFSARRAAGPEGLPNQARHAFLDPAAREFYRQWDAVAAETVSYLRRDAGLHPEDPELGALVGELSLRSEEFGRLWADHLVREKTHGAKQVRHPLVGDLDLGYETLAVNGSPDQLLVVYTAPVGSPTAQKLALLGSWTAPGAAPEAAAEASGAPEAP
ncbi:helix-turn-helix protein [Streptomyces sp. 1114.5]|uniref:helix-turn-helix transcriptional regulator n=1 Tax=unclassified Streptomyces TaxID=2593676 RepID=UPI000BD2CA74|nr:MULTISPECIES: helix-turn-helix transcriptional regulator [unclassified Streptomyces]RKT17097.1 helix-turn-helix protein [Streptomyces sp. 1114.5]SOB83307.1 Helix-turn-helix domain-containing protein [Streptomyces sp. 1331.2]